MINKAKFISCLDHLRRRWRELRKASAGNVAVTFALTLVPVAGCVGAAVDYSRANSAKVAMQAAADATALMLSKTAATVTSAQLQTSATNYFKALFNRSEVTGLTVTPTYTDGGRLQDHRQSDGLAESRFHGPVRHYEHERRRILAGGLGQHAASRCVGARQHRLDAGRRQDDCPDHRDQQPADPAQDRRGQQRRRVCLDRSVRQGRQCRQEQLPGDLDRLVRLERQQRQLQRQRLGLGSARQTKSSLQRNLDARQPQHLERLRDGPRQLQRSELRQLRHQRDRSDDDHPGDALRGRAVQFLPRTRPSWR